MNALQKNQFLSGQGLASAAKASAVRGGVRPARLVVQAGRIGPGKDWEQRKLTKNGKPVLLDLHVKTGDMVKVIAGSDKGKVGKITKVDRKSGQVVMEGVNIRTKHVKPMGDEEEGQILRTEFPIHHSNVQHYSEAQGVVSRIGHKIEGGKKVRYLKKTGEVLAN